jgi:hypothetical protein
VCSETDFHSSSERARRLSGPEAAGEEERPVAVLETVWRVRPAVEEQHWEEHRSQAGSQRKENVIFVFYICYFINHTISDGPPTTNPSCFSFLFKAPCAKNLLFSNPVIVSQLFINLLFLTLLFYSPRSWTLHYSLFSFVLTSRFSPHIYLSISIQISIFFYLV